MGKRSMIRKLILIFSLINSGGSPSGADSPIVGTGKVGYMVI